MTQHSNIDPTAALSDLTTDIVDTLKGYSEMADRAEPELLPIVERLQALHETHAAALMETLGRLGGHPEAAGSAMGVINVAVAAARDWIGALDATAIPHVVEGEKRLLASYTTALRVLSHHQNVAQLVQDQRDVLAEHVRAIELG